MSLRTEVDQVIGNTIKSTEAGLAALTTGPVQMDEAGSEAMEDVLKLREAVLALCDVIDSRLSRI